METKSKINARTGRPRVSSRGGARPGAGRPRGSVDKVTINSLLTAIDTASGRPYVELLAADFAQARATDLHLAQKYHHLILNKVSASLAAVEVTSTADEVEQKKAAFAEAIATIAGIK